MVCEQFRGAWVGVRKVILQALGFEGERSRVGVGSGRAEAISTWVGAVKLCVQMCHKAHGRAEVVSVGAHDVHSDDGNLLDMKQMGEMCGFVRTRGWDWATYLVRYGGDDLQQTPGSRQHAS